MSKALVIDHKTMTDIAMSAYAGAVCTICGRPIETLEDLNDAVVSGLSEKKHIRLAHKGCWDGRE